MKQKNPRAFDRRDLLPYLGLRMTSLVQQIIPINWGLSGTVVVGVLPPETLLLQRHINSYHPYFLFHLRP